MISRPLLWFIALAFLALLAIAWWAGRYPAQLTIINTSGSDVTEVKVSSGDEQFTIGHVANGEFRRFSFRPGATLTIRCGEARFESAGKLTPAQSLVVYVVPGPQFEARSKLGTLSR